MFPKQHEGLPAVAGTHLDYISAGIGWNLQSVWRRSEYLLSGMLLELRPWV